MKTRLCLAPLALCAPALAQVTYVVDDNGGAGVDFTEIQPAVDAAGPLDVVMVRHGLYGDVVIDHDVTVMGEAPGTLPAEWARIDDIVVLGLASAESVVLTDLRIDSIVATDCDGMLLVDSGRVDDIDVERSQDVRLQSLGELDFFYRTRSLTITDSRVQCVSTFFLPWSAAGETDGSPCVVATRSSLILSECDVQGGGGGDQQLCLGGYIPNGGPGLLLTESSVRVLGGSVVGGEEGFNCFGFPAGLRGKAIELDALSTVLESDAVLNYSQIQGAGTVTNDDGQPRFVLEGAESPGGVATFSFRTAPGSSLRGYLGRFATVQPIPGFDVPLFHTAERGVSLGAAPMDGVLDINWPIPALPPGTLVHIQGMRTLVGGASEYSNGITLVVR